MHPGSAGTGIWTALSQIAAEVLGLRIENVHIVTGDTDVTLWDMGSGADRTCYTTGSTVMLAAQRAKEHLLEKAAKMMRLPPTHLDVKDGQVYAKNNPKKRIPVAVICEEAAMGGPDEVEDIYGKATWHARSMAPPFMAFFAEVEVDTETGVVKLIRLVTAGDVGRAINPMTVEGQFEGCAQMFLGYALTEEWYIKKDSGVLATDSFATYKMPSQLDMPKFDVILTENPDPTGPFGAKGAGEGGGAGVASAIANAVYDAIGVQIKELPITPEKILESLKALTK